MKDLIEALNIFLKYLKDPNDLSPTHCEHDVLYVMGVTRKAVSREDRARLNELDFLWSDSDDAWISYRFGSA